MMRTVVGLMVVGLVTTSAFGGMVAFDPAEVTINEGEGAGLSFGVSVATGAGIDFESVDMIVGSDTISLDPADWAYSAAATTAFGPFIGTPADQPIYPDGIGGIGGFAFMGPVTSPFDLGTLAVDASTLPLGDHYLSVDGDRDDGRSGVAYGTESERIFGSAVIHVVPEPMTIALLGLGAVGLLRRRK